MYGLLRLHPAPLNRLLRRIVLIWENANAWLGVRMLSDGHATYQAMAS